MATRKTYTDEQKKALIQKYKERYINAPRSFIKGEKVTEEIFDSMHESEQWHRIYMNYVRKNESKSKQSSSGKKGSFAKIRTALNTIEKSVDSMTDNQIQKTLAAFEDIKKYIEDKSSREQEQRVKELEDKEAQLKEQLEKILDEKSKLINAV